MDMAKFILRILVCYYRYYQFKNDLAQYFQISHTAP